MTEEMYTKRVMVHEHLDVNIITLVFSNLMFSDNLSNRIDGLHYLREVARDLKMLKADPNIDDLVTFGQYWAQFMSQSSQSVEESDLEAAREYLDIQAANNPRRRHQDYLPTSNRGMKFGLEGISTLVKFNLPQLVNRYFPEIGLEYIDEIQNSIGHKIKSMSKNIKRNGSLGVYFLDVNNVSKVVKIGHEKKISLEHDMLELISISMLANFFPKIQEKTYTTIGNHAFFVMDDINKKVPYALDIHPIKDILKKVAYFHHYGKELFNADWINSQMLKSNLTVMDFGNASEINEQIIYLKKKNAERKKPLPQDIVDDSIAKLMGGVPLYSDFAQYLIAFSEWGLAHKDMIPVNTNNGFIYDLGNSALAPLIFDVSRFLGQLRTFNRISRQEEFQYLKVYFDTRMHLNEQYSISFDELINQYETAKFIDNTRLCYCVALDTSDAEFMDGLAVRANSVSIGMQNLRNGALRI